MQQRVVYFYLLWFTVCYIMHFVNHGLLSQLKTPFFVNRLDLTRNLFIAAGFTKVQGSLKTLVILDVVYLVLPFIYFIAWKNKSRLTILAAISLVVFNFYYYFLLTSLSIISIEDLLGWVMIPILFLSRKDNGYYFTFNFLRYYFLFFVSSVAVWKIITGSVFNPDQMSGILVFQHANLLYTAPESLWGRWYSWLIEHRVISQGLLVAACAIQLSFITGFFTKRYDRLLVALYLMFLVADLLLMQINYFDSFIFCALLYFSRSVEYMDEKA